MSDFALTSRVTSLLGVVVGANRVCASISAIPLCFGAYGLVVEALQLVCAYISRIITDTKSYLRECTFILRNKICQAWQRESELWY